jgi:hypothetical protein
MTTASSNPPWGRIIATLACLAALPICYSIATNLYADFPSYADWACGETKASGCYEWGLITVGPFYLLFLLLFVAVVAGLAAIPLLILPIIWLRGRRTTSTVTKPADVVHVAETASTVPIEKTYHNLTVVDSSRKTKPVASRATAETTQATADLADDAGNVSVGSAIKEIFSRADRNA